MINLVGKVKPVLNQLQEAVNDGFKSVELQLFDDFLDQSIDEVVDALRANPGIRVTSIHSPLLSGREVEVEELADSNTKLPILKTFYLADILGKEYGVNMPVVVHMTSRMDMLQTKKDTLYKIVRELDVALTLFPRVELCIENTIPLISKGDRYETKNSFLFDSVEICKFLRQQLKTDRVYTVLDVCHAMISIEFMKDTHEFTQDKMYSLKDFFRENGEYTRIIHFNNIKNNGMGVGEHGTPFRPDDIEDVIRMQHVIDYYLEYTPQATLVMEICEDRYDINCNVNKLLTLETFKKLKIDYELI